MKKRGAQYKNTIDLFWSRIAKTEHGCWEWDKPGKGGYGTFSYLGTDWLPHRFAYTLVKGEIPAGKVNAICHTCDNRRCCNPDHLYLGDDSTNQIDKVRRNRAPQAKLTQSDALVIRLDQRPMKVIAKEYGVTYQTIWNVKHKKTFYWL